MLRLLILPVFIYSSLILSSESMIRASFTAHGLADVSFEDYKTRFFSIKTVEEYKKFKEDYTARFSAHFELYINSVFLNRNTFVYKVINSSTDSTKHDDLLLFASLYQDGADLTFGYSSANDLICVEDCYRDFLAISQETRENAVAKAHEIVAKPKLLGTSEPEQSSSFVPVNLAKTKIELEVHSDDLPFATQKKSQGKPEAVTENLATSKKGAFPRNTFLLITSLGVLTYCAYRYQKHMKDEVIKPSRKNRE